MLLPIYVDSYSGYKANERPTRFQLDDETYDKRGPYEFVLSAVAHCPNCRAEITEKTLVEPQCGIEVEERA